jgi:hypothetical protein
MGLGYSAGWTSFSLNMLQEQTIINLFRNGHAITRHKA